MASLRAEEKHPLTLPSTKEKPSSLLPLDKLILSLFLFFTFSLLLSYFYVSPPQFRLRQSDASSHRRQAAACDSDIASFYIYDLPERFDRDLIRRCRSLSPNRNMCPHVANRGLGQPVAHRPDWFATNQFVAAMLFRARAERHPCRTLDPGDAELFYVPFYAGLYASSASRQRNATLRDALGVDLAQHVSRLPTFRRRGGRDHFLIAGRVAWELMRSASAASAGENSTTNRFLRLPELANVSVLTIERFVWDGRNQFGIPYPSYFHPRSAGELAAWQEEVRRAERTHLFAFVGGARIGGQKEVVRALVLQQCGSSSRCLQLECKRGSNDCRSAVPVMDVLMRAEFCLQPPGDTPTRRSVFDSVLAGCVPVFFSENTAYTQYQWYAPARAEEWSVFLGPERRGRIEEELSRIPKDAVARMREAVIGMIPRVTYAHPNASWAEGRRLRDAVDVALAALTERVRDTLSESNNNNRTK